MVQGLFLSLLLLVGCFGDDRPHRGARRDRHLINPGTPRLGAGAIPEGSPRLDPSLANGPTLDELPVDQPGLVVLVVLDGVRADHLAACGYDRPTSPATTALVERGGVLSCHAYAPATWSHATEATLLTGRDPEDHRVFRKGGAPAAGVGTLAEAMVAKGYQSILVTGNPALKAGAPLARGFHTVHVGTPASLAGEGVTRALRYELAQIDPKRPLFLVVEVTDASDPFAAVPAGLPWVPAQAALGAADPRWKAFQQGALPDATSFLDAVRNGYDHGVSKADASLAAIAKLIEKHELGKHGVRLVATSDRGTALGEHGRLGQGGAPYEGTTRVPVLIVDSTQREHPPTLPEPLALTAVFGLVVDGRVPDPAPSVHAVAAASDAGGQGDAVAVWTSATRKLVWTGGRSAAYDLATDAAEASPLPLKADETATLDAAVARWQAVADAARSAADEAPATPAERPRRRRPR